MNDKLPYWCSVFFSAVALFLLLVNAMITTNNRAAQTDISQRQATLAGGQTLNQLNQGLIQLMAEAVIKNNNTQLRDLLVSQGITIKSDAAAAAKPADKK